MTDTAKKRLAIDLDEIERQLRQTAPQHSAPKNDPLAELARVVGQEDPFRAILSADRAGVEPRRVNTEADDIFALGTDPRSTAREDHRDEGYREQLYGREDHGHDGQAQQDYHEPAYQEYVQPHSFDAYIDEAATPRYAQAPQRESYRDDDVYAEPAYAGSTAHQQQDDWREPALYAEPEQYDDRHDDSAYDMDRTPPKRSRRTMLTVGAVLGVAVLGVASALVFSGGGSGLVDGEPPVISAGTEPIKIAPENPGGVEIPNQDRQIFGASDGETQIVDREEQPVDIGEVAREAPRVILPPPAGVQGRDDDPISQVLAGRQPTAELQSPSVVSTAVAALGEPRRVRTVSVRPDGTIIGSASAGQVAQAQPEARSISDLASAQPFQSEAAAPSQAPQVSADQAPPAPLALTQPAVPVQEPAQQVQQPAPSGPLSLTGALPPTPQRDSPAQQQEAPREVAAIPAPAPAAPAVTQTGGYAVQLAIRDTEERAFAAFAQYQTRYAGIIGNVDPIVRRAEVNGNTIYRIRVGPYALGEANTICERIKGSGGDCFVARN